MSSVLASRSATVWSLAHDVGLAVVAVTVTVASAEIRIPIGLPGHRGIIWLASLVATALVTRHRESVIAVGGASTLLAQVLHIAPGVGPSARYLAAAVLLYAASFVPVIGRRGWFIALAAAPIHLVALFTPTVAGLHRGHLVSPLTNGLSDKVLFHLAFGLVAGLIGWGVASTASKLNLIASQRTNRCSGGTEK
jgi:hypothetical protein